MLDDDPLYRALLSLEGLAIGDAFGEMCSYAPPTARERVRDRTLPPGP